MPGIDTLIPDIQRLLKTRGWFDAYSETFGHGVSARLKDQYDAGPRAPGLRLSKMGPNCPKALWYSVHHSELAEELPPWAEMKYSFGHMSEALAIVCAKASGHRVEGEQDELTLDGIKGHRDCVIDGCIVDVKSLSSRAFLKLKQRTLETDDPFGYLDQLDGYSVASRDDPLVITKDRAYLFGIDRLLGGMVLYEHRVRAEKIKARIKEAISTVELKSPPECTCVCIPDGKSGNIRLGVRASYSPQKFTCFPNLRTFLYADGPRYLTRVERVPEVPEINKHGVFIN